LSTDLKAVAVRWFEEWWNQRSDDVIEEITTPDCLSIVEGLDGGLNREGLREYRRAWLNAVPDIHVDILFAVTEGTNVVVHWRATGTHLGPGLGIPPSGRPVDFSGLTKIEFVNGLMHRGFDGWNRGEMIASLMQVRMQELQEHAGLTAREAQVALLMADRLTHTEIASELKIKPNTARRHCEKVLFKLGVKRRQQVAQALGRIPGSVLNRHGSDLEKETAAAV
jgi:DNA-binding CsgD family transcriptional regulator/predicted ester cyclase